MSSWKVYVNFMLGAISAKVWGLWPGLLLCTVAMLAAASIFDFKKEGRE